MYSYFPQICSLPELLAFVLNTLKRKRKRNVLAHGYNFQTLAQEDRDADFLKFQGDVTQSAAYIHGSDLWKKVITRLGTDITQYLLESCSVFVAVPPSCAFQVCGPPVYDRVSMTTASCGFFLQPRVRKHNRTKTESCRGSVSLKQKRTVVTPASKKMKRRNKGGTKGKRKRETGEEEEVAVCSRKRRRVASIEHQQAIQQVDSEKEGQAVAVESAPPTAFKQPVEMPTFVLPLEGGPSWRTGIFPPLPPSQCFIRTLGFLYGGRGMRGFLLNRRKKTAHGSRRLQGQDLVRIVFFEGLAHLNGVERKPKKLSQRFFGLVPLFRQLLQQHRRCPYTRILQRLCPSMEESNAGQGELNSLLPQHCAPHRVYLFVRECLSSVIPQELWGSDQNRLHFFARVRTFLQSGKFERLSLAELMWKIKVNDCDWLKRSKTGEVSTNGLFFFFFFMASCFMPDLTNVTHLQAVFHPASLRIGHRSWVSSWLGFWMDMLQALWEPVSMQQRVLGRRTPSGSTGRKSGPNCKNWPSGTLTQHYYSSQHTYRHEAYFQKKGTKFSFHVEVTFPKARWRSWLQLRWHPCPKAPSSPAFASFPRLMAWGLSHES